MVIAVNPHQDAPLRFMTVVGALLALLGLVVGGVIHTSPPAERNETVVTSFSADRAMSHLQQIAHEPHPIGSEANAKVRNYLISQLKELGLEPQVQEEFTARPLPWGSVVGVPRNVIVRLPGRTPGKAVMVTAHYDSVSTGPGAGDNGASVAAALEVLRAVKSGPQLENDVICVFTDGEEVGMLGASAFVSHPWAKQVGVVLNFEYRGNRGSFVLFETSTNNGALVSAYQSAVPNPMGSSLWYELYKLMPNNTDFSVFREAGMPGMNLAAAEGYTHYHTRLDRPDQLSKATLQHEGNTMLALVQRLGNAPLDQTLVAPDRIFFDVPGIGMTSYPASWSVGIAVLATALLAVVCVVAIRKRRARVGRIAVAVPAFVLSLLLIAALCHFIWRGIIFMHPQYESFLQGDTYNSQWYLLAFLGISLGLFLCVLKALKRWVGALEFGLGAMLVWALLLWGSALQLPGASYVLAWPLIAATLALLVVVIRSAAPQAEGANLAVLIAGAVPGIVIYSGLAWYVYIALTPFMSGAAVAVIVLVLGLLAPMLEVLSRARFAPAWPLALAACFLGVGSLTSGFDSLRPRQNSLTYAQAGDGKAYWLSTDSELDSWTSAVLGKDTKRRSMPELFGAQSRPFWTAKAPASLLAPKLDVLYDRKTAKTREIGVRIASPRLAPRMVLVIDGAKVLSSDVEGRPLTRKPDGHWALEAYSIPEGGMTISLAIAQDAPFSMRLMDVSNGLPATVPPRPADLIPRPTMINDSSLAFAIAEFK